MELGPAPYHLTAVRGAETLYVSSRAEPRVWVVDQRTLETRSKIGIGIGIGSVGHQMALAARYADAAGAPYLVLEKVRRGDRDVEVVTSNTISHPTNQIDTRTLLGASIDAWLGAGSTTSR